MARPRNEKGTTIDVQKGTYGRLTINRDNKLYYVYKALRSDEKTIMDSILTYMDSASNIITVNGATLDAIVDDSGYSPKTVRNVLSLLCKTNLLESTLQLDREYIINPIFAIKGGNDISVWQAYQSLHYNNNTPKDVRVTYVENGFTNY